MMGLKRTASDNVVKLFRNVMLAVLFCFVCGLMMSAMSDDSDAAIGDRFVVDGITYEIVSESGYNYVIIYNVSPSVRVFDDPYAIYDGFQFDIISIGEYAFEGCTSLTSVILPDTITSVRTGAFKGCTSLTSVTFGNGLTVIGNEAFSGCTSLTSVSIGGIFDSLGDSAFSGCTSLKTVNLPDSILSIGDSVFSGCTSLKTVNIPSRISSISDRMFYGCTSLTSAIIPNTIRSIGEQAFCNCTSIVSLIISNNVKSLGKGAFANCTGLRELSIPISFDAVVDNNAPAFSGCTNLEKVTFTPGFGRGCDYYELPSEGICFEYTPWHLSRGSLTTVIIEGGVHLEALHPCGCSLVLRVPASLGVPESGVSQDLEPWGPRSPQGSISQPEFGGSVDSSVYVSN